MRKSLFVFVLFVGFTATGCATGGGGYLGQNPYPGPLGQVVAGNLALTCPGDYFIGPPINRCLRNLSGDIGRYSSYPMYRGGMGGPQLSQADKLAVFCGLGGSGVATLLDAGLKKTIGAGFLSAAVCEATALVGSRRGNNKNQVVVTPPPSQQSQQRSPQPQQGQQNVYWSHGAPVAVGSRPNVPTIGGGYQPMSSPSQQGGGWKIRNRTGFKVELLDGDRFVIMLQPGQSMSLSNPEGIRGVMLIPSSSGTSSGTIDREDATIKASRNFDGWDLMAPSVP